MTGTTFSLALMWCALRSRDLVSLADLVPA